MHQGGTRKAKLESKFRLEASLKDNMEPKWRLDSPNGVQVAPGGQFEGPNGVQVALGGNLGGAHGGQVAFQLFPSPSPIRADTTIEGTSVAYVATWRRELR